MSWIKSRKPEFNQRPIPIPSRIIDDILENLPEVHSLDDLSSYYARKTLLYNTKNQLLNIELVPIESRYEELKKKIYMHFETSRILDDQKVGLYAAESLSASNSQMTMSSFHQAGSAQVIGAGLKSIDSLLRAVKDRHDPNITIHFHKNIWRGEEYVNFTPKDIIDMRSILVQMNITDFIKPDGIEVSPFENNIDRLDIDKEEFIENYGTPIFKSWWHDMYELSVDPIPKSLFVMRLYFDVNLLYAHRVSLSKIAETIIGTENALDITIVHSPLGDGILDIFPNIKFSNNPVITETIFLYHTTKGLLSGMKVKGIVGLKSLSPIKVDVSLAFKDEKKPKRYEQNILGFEIIKNLHRDGFAENEIKDINHMNFKNNVRKVPKTLGETFKEDFGQIILNSDFYDESDDYIYYSYPVDTKLKISVDEDIEDVRKRFTKKYESSDILSIDKISDTRVIIRHYPYGNEELLDEKELYKLEDKYIIQETNNQNKIFLENICDVKSEDITEIDNFNNIWELTLNIKLLSSTNISISSIKKILEMCEIIIIHESEYELLDNTIGSYYVYSEGSPKSKISNYFSQNHNNIIFESFHILDTFKFGIKYDSSFNQSLSVIKDMCLRAGFKCKRYVNKLEIECGENFKLLVENLGKANDEDKLKIFMENFGISDKNKMSNSQKLLYDKLSGILKEDQIFKLFIELLKTKIKNPVVDNQKTYVYAVAQCTVGERSKKVTEHDSVYYDLIKIPWIDSSKTISNNLHEIQKIIGIEASRNYFLWELTQMYQMVKVSINLRHILIAAENIFRLGYPSGVAMNGIIEHDIGFFSTAAVEKTPQRLAQSYGQKESVMNIIPATLAGVASINKTNLEEYRKKRAREKREHEIIKQARIIPPPVEKTPIVYIEDKKEYYEDNFPNFDDNGLPVDGPSRILIKPTISIIDELLNIDFGKKVNSLSWFALKSPLSKADISSIPLKFDYSFLSFNKCKVPNMSLQNIFDIYSKTSVETIKSFDSYGRYDYVELFKNIIEPYDETYNYFIDVEPLYDFFADGNLILVGY